MKKIIRFLTIISLVFGLHSIAMAYADVPDTHQNFVAIEYLDQKDVIQGYADGNYKPEQLVNRVEALKLIFKNSAISVQTSDIYLEFTDVDNTAWYAPYLAAAKKINIINGNPDGTFRPDNTVIRSEFLKMLLQSKDFVKEKWENIQIYNDVPQGEWYTPYMNYAGQAGLLTPDLDQKIYPGFELTRGEVAEILYIMDVILQKENTQFLLEQAEKQLSQIDIYIGNNNPDSAKRASELAVDMTQQAYNNLPEDKVVLGAAKLARAYNFVVNAYISAVAQKRTAAADWAKQAITKATEAWEVNPDTQVTAHHIKERAEEILAQL